MSRTLPLIVLATVLALPACQRAPEPSGPSRPEPALEPTLPASPVTPQADAPAMGSSPPADAAGMPVQDPQPQADAPPRDGLPPASP